MTARELPLPAAGATSDRAFGAKSVRAFGAESALGEPDSCTVCSDEATLVEVVSAGPVDAQCVDPCGRRSTVAVDLVGTVAPGDRLLVHAGVAIGRATTGGAP